MTCPQCDQAQLVQSDATKLTGKYRGSAVTVEMQGLQCPNCGYATVHGRDMAAFQKAVQEAYRQKRSAELREFRETRRLSQAAFAKLIGAGIASVKRWEAGQLPDEGSDERIRMKSDPRMGETLIQDAFWQVSRASGDLSELPLLEQQMSTTWINTLEWQAAREYDATTGSLSLSWSTIKYICEGRATHGPEEAPVNEEETEEECALAA